MARTARLGLVPTGLSGPSAPYAGRLLIPYLTRAGVASAKYRCIEHSKCEGHGKYMGIDGVDTLLYNVNDFFNDSLTIAICEGEFDALVLSKLVGIPAIGVPGVAAWKEHHVRCFAGQYERVLIFADADEAGRSFATRLVKGDYRKGLMPLEGGQIVYLPDGEDVSSLYVKEGAEALRARAGLGSTETIEE